MATIFDTIFKTFLIPVKFKILLRINDIFKVIVLHKKYGLRQTTYTIFLCDKKNK